MAEWVAKRTDGGEFDKYVTIGVCQDKKLLAAVVYHGYRPDYKNIEMSIAADSPKWATAHAIGTFLKYPFEKLGCERVTACCRSSNKRVRKFNTGIGFTEEGVLRMGYGDEDMIIFGMMRNEAKKWIGE